VHLARADLDLQRLPFHRDHGRMERLIAAFLAVRNVVVELAGDRPPQRVDLPEHAVALGQRVDQDAHGEQVVDLRDLSLASAHLPINAEDVLRTAGDVSRNADLLELRV
jgi:hypothetical protein